MRLSQDIQIVLHASIKISLHLVDQKMIHSPIISEEGLTSDLIMDFVQVRLICVHECVPIC